MIKQKRIKPIYGRGNRDKWLIITMGNLTAKQAKETQIFYVDVKTKYRWNTEKRRGIPDDNVISDFSVVETNLYEFVMRSVDETTSPRGVAPRLFYERETMEGYVSHLNSSDSISVDAFENLTEKEQFAYFFSDEAFENFRIYTWGAAGNNCKYLGYNFDIEEKAEDFLFQRVYDGDFQGECNRNTIFYLIEEEAKNDMFESIAECFDISEATAKSIYSKQIKVDARRLVLEAERKLAFQNSKKRSKEEMLQFILENKELIQSKKEELLSLKAFEDKVNWQIKANALVQIVSKNDFRCLGWKEVYTLINTAVV